MTAQWKFETYQDGCFACAFSPVTNIRVACWDETVVFLALACLWSKGHVIVLAGEHSGVVPCQCVCDTEAGSFAGAGKGERVTELMQRHKQEMTLFGEHVSLWVGTSSNYPTFSDELTSNYCYSLIKVCKLKIFFFSSPDWVKYRYSQLTKVLNIILVHPWKGSVTKRKPNKKSSEPRQTWVRV